MAEKIILTSTSILIDIFRKSDKANSVFVKLAIQGYQFRISSITEYEVYSVATTQQLPFWDNLLQKIDVLSFAKNVVKQAVIINTQLKQKRKQIEMAELFIAATDVAFNLPFTTLNRKHFERFKNPGIIELDGSTLTQ